MLALAFATVLTGSTPAVVDGVQPPCRAQGPRTVVGRADGRPRKLEEMPPAVGFKAVLKSVDGCPVSVLLQRGPDGKPIERLLEDEARAKPTDSGRQGRSQRQR